MNCKTCKEELQWISSEHGWYQERDTERKRKL